MTGAARLLADQLRRIGFTRRAGSERPKALGVLAAALLASISSQTSFAQTMSLPGKFSVGATGSATYDIPISVPPGTAGLAPSLSLEYNSHGGNGLLGVGWSLGGLPSIGRCARTVAQDGVLGGIDFDANDRFCMDGQRLVVVSGTYGTDGAVYRTEVDTFSKIISHGTAGNGPGWFEVHTKSGQIMQFGNTPDSQILAQGKSTARNWALNKVSDTKGNYFTITYTNDTANGQAYPIEIDYTGNAATNLSPNNKVQFIYATRPDISPQYQAGSLSKTTVRMTDVKTYSGSTLVADYSLGYQSITTVSQLASITICGGASSCLPTTTFNWTSGTTGQFPLQYRQSNYPTDGQIWRAGTDSGGTSTLMGDVDGDGKADLIQISNGNYQAQVLLSNGGGTFRRVYEEQNYPTDGQIWRGNIPANGPTDGYSTFVGDVDGDGKADLIQIANGSYQAQVLLSNGDGTFRRAYQEQNYPTDGQIWRAGSDVVTTYLADVNGDGKADIVQIDTQDYKSQVLLSNGDGTFRLAFRQSNYPTDGQIWRGYIPANGPTDGYSTFVGDVDGDGKSDLIQISNGSYQAQVLLSNGDGTFRRAYQEQNYPTDGQIWRAGSDVYTTYLADVNGDGKADIVQIGTQVYQAQVLTPDGSIDRLLSSMTTGLGAMTSIAYLPLTNGGVYTKDSGANAASYPVQDLQSPLYIVSQVITSNGVGGTYSSSYSYAGAKLDLSGRGFLGFRQMTVKDLQTGISDTTNYLQSFPYVGLAASTTRTVGAQTLGQSVNTFQFSNSGGTTTVSPSSAPYQVSLSQNVSSGADLDGSALPTVTTSNQYDGFGNARQVVISTSDGFSKSTTNTYTNDTTNWYLGRLTQSSVTSVAP